MTMILPWKHGSYSPTKAYVDKFATEDESRLRLKKKTNHKWIFYLTLVSTTTVSLVLLIIFFALNVERLKRHHNFEVFDQENLRIVNGIEAKAHSWPAQAVVLFHYYVGNYSFSNSTDNMTFIDKPYGTLCGGTLINRWTIMTAGHCIAKSFEYEHYNISFEIDVVPNEYYPTYESMYTVILGDHHISDYSKKYKTNTVQNHRIQKIIRHENYSGYMIDNDIALLILERPAQLNKKVQIACLPLQNSSSYPLPGTTAYAVGWGIMQNDAKDSPDALQNTVITTMSDSVCRKGSGNYRDSQLCATDMTGQGKSVCHGDSGGSLYVKEQRDGKEKFVSAGVVSYGKLCGNSRFPGYFTRVSYYLDWIKRNMKNH